MSNTAINGKVKFYNSSLPLTNLRIEVWDGGGTKGILSSAHSDIDGNFKCILGESTSTYTYKVYRGDVLLDISVVVDPTSSIENINVEIKISEDDYDKDIKDPEINERVTYLTISGQLTDQNKLPIANKAIKVLENGFWQEDLLGQTTTNLLGKYEIKIATRLIANAKDVFERSIIVKAVNIEILDEVVLAKSDAIFLGEISDLEIDLIANDTFRAPSLFETLIERVEVLLDDNVDLETYGSDVEFDNDSIVPAPADSEVAAISIDNTKSARDNGDANGKLSLMARMTSCSLFDLQCLFRSIQFGIDAFDSNSFHKEMFALTRETGLYRNPLLKMDSDQIKSNLVFAINNNIITDPYPELTGEPKDAAINEYIENFIEETQHYLIESTKNINIPGEQYNIGNVLSKIFAGVNDPETSVNDFLRMYNQEAKTDLEDFWDHYHNTYDGDGSGKFVERGLRIAAIAGYQPEITGYLVGITTENHIAPLALKTLEQWVRDIEDVSGDAGKLCIPDAIQGESDEERIELYAKKLKSLVQDLYPLTALRSALVVGDGQQQPPLIEDEITRADVKDFIDANPLFDLRVNNIYDISFNNFSGEKLQNLQQALGPVQRLMRIVGGNPEAITAMMMDGVTSADAIEKMPLESFSAAYSAKLGGAPSAVLAYSKATAVSKLALEGLVSSYTVVKAPDTSVIPGKKWTIPIEPHADPNLTTMFGSMSYCACEQCLSVYSPAAYFTDILHFLKDGDSTAYDELKRRRPDLEHIDMTCKNTNTQLPYIDLVIELLERLALSEIVPIISSTSALAYNTNIKSYQTKGTALELAAHPEHIYKDVTTVSGGPYTYEYKEDDDYELVYDVTTGLSYYNLSSSVYPLNLPFSLAAEEARTYLTHLGSNRYELMKLFRWYSGSDPITDLAVNSEFLGLTEVQGSIVNNTHPLLLGSTPSTYKFYGFTNPTVSGFIDPSDTSLTIGSLAWEALLSSRLDVLVQQMKITYKQFLQFLTTDFLNKRVDVTRHRYITISAKSGAPADTCDITKLELVFEAHGSVTSVVAQTEFYWKLHRFIRLWKTNIMEVEEWDALFTALRITKLDEYEFPLVPKVLQICKKLGMKASELFGWWGYLDIHQYVDYGSGNLTPKPSAYDLLFRNKSVINPPDPLFVDLGNRNIDLFPAGFFTSSTLYYNNYASYIASANNLKENEVIELLAYLGVTISTTIVVTFEVLSKINAIANISRSLGYTIAEFILLCNLLNLSVSALTALPTVPTASSSGTIAPELSTLEQLLAAADVLKYSGFSIAELDYLIQNSDIYSPVGPSPLNIQYFYESLRNELQKFPLFSFPSGSISSWTDDEENNYNRLVNNVYQFFSKEFSIPSERVKLIFNETVVSGTGVPPIIYDLLSNSLNLTASGGYFVDSIDPIIETTLSSALLPIIKNLYNTYRLVYKISYIAQRINLNSFEFPYLLVNDAVVGFNFINIPVEVGVSPSVGMFDQFLQLIRWINVRNKLQLVEEQLVTLLKAANNNILTSAGIISTSLGFSTWKSIINRDIWGNMLEDLIGVSVSVPDGILQSNYPVDFTPSSSLSVKRLWNIIEIISNCRRVGMVPATLYEVVKQDLTLNEAHKVLVAAKGKHSESAWAAIAKPLRDTLRKKQRDALVGFVLNHPDVTTTTNYKKWRHENDLYAFLLIDVEMEACMKTSRIKQGICSVQLFIDRMLLGLETSNYGSHIALNTTMSQQWELWRAWYRIWEANRKIFLYPENWIEPELRDDKSIFFKEMEEIVQQGDITQGRAEDAILSYLRKLQTVARLEPVTACENLDPATNKVVYHAFARTYSEPYEFFYRRLVDNEWTAWERIEIDIKSNQVAAIVYLGKLYLYWFTFRERSVVGNTNTYNYNMANNSSYNHSYWYHNDQKAINTESTTDSKAVRTRQLEVTLHWSEYKDGQWQEHKVAKEKMFMNINPILDKVLPGVFDYSAVAGTPGLTPANYSGTLDYYTYLTDSRTKSLTDLLISRIMIQTEVFPDNKGIPVLWVFLNSPSNFFDTTTEDSHNHHAFVLTADAREPKVWDYWSGRNWYAPTGTVFKDGKLVQFPRIDSASKATPQPIKAYHDSLNIDSIKFIARSAYCYPGEHMTIATATGTKQQIRMGSPVKILKANPNGIYKLVAHQDVWNSLLSKGFFYEDNNNTFFARVVDPTTFPVATAPPSLASVAFPGDVASTSQQFYFQNFSHTQVNDYIAKLNSGGIDAFLTLASQQDDPWTDTINFNSNYSPTSIVYSSSSHPYPRNVVDFEYTGAYSIYNWELFFHTPLLIAKRLSDNQQFEDARKWYHYIFDPTSTVDEFNMFTPSKKRFWKFRPFYKEATATVTTLADLMDQINANVTAAVAQVTKWEANPFKPHVIARMRTLAYMKNVVMCYLDNLIAWGDNLFRQDTIESINQATQLYIMAANILGEKPQEIPARAETGPRTFEELYAIGLDAFSNAKVAIEHYIDPNSGPAATTGGGYPSSPNVAKMFYFCLPNNPKLLGYWDTVANRLFNIRNCRNIDGVKRELPLFEPPIDPALLVRAAAAGLDASSVLDDLSSPPMPYRFNVMQQKANELCNDVKSLGGALLSALEKQDAEALSLIRSGQEIVVMESMKQMKKLQIDEAAANIEALNKTKDVTQARYTYYSTRQYKSSKEIGHLGLLDAAQFHQNNASTLQAIASVMSILPEINIQAPFAIGPSFGGRELSAMFSALSTIQSQKAAQRSAEATKTITEAGYERRMEDWQFQAQTAQKELIQLDKQIIASQIRKSIAEKDLATQELQIENAKTVDEYMRSKFTNTQLYSWMVAQVSATFFQSYQMAYDVAKRAEKSLVYEVPWIKIPGTGFIKFGYWDSLKKGLLSGEKLQYDLRKMELAHLESNTRELEVTKHISLAMFDPAELLELRQSGTCHFNLLAGTGSPNIYDYDYPGHYMRRIKSVSISIPCVAGPYTTIAATVTRNSWMIEDATGGVHSSSSAAESFATSGAQNDSGMFELNLRDERYLPFEGTGAVSNWTIKLMDEEALRQFDYNTISDVILHVKYTAQFEITKEIAVKSALATAIVGGSSGTIFNRYFSLKHEFSNAWFAYGNEYPSDSSTKMSIKLSNALFPYLCAGKAISITQWTLVIKPKPTLTAGWAIREEHLVSTSTTSSDFPIPTIPPLPSLPSVSTAVSAQINMGETKEFKLNLQDSIATGASMLNLTDHIEDIYLIVTYNLLP